MSDQPLPAPDPGEVRRRLEARGREDRHDAWLLVGLGVPFAAAGLLFLSGGLFMLLLLLPIGIGWGAKYLLAVGVSFAAALIDTWRHPSEHWYRARFYLADGTVAGDEAATIADGWAAGMPAMASATDPHNWAARGAQLANGCSNLVLGGFRNIRKGVERLVLARRRSRPENVNAANEFLGWLSEHAPVDPRDLEAHLTRRPVLVAGYALAVELGFIGGKLVDGRKFIELRGRPSV